MDAAAHTPKLSIGRKILRVFTWGLAATFAFTLALGLVAGVLIWRMYPTAQGWWDEAITVAEQHLRFEVAHPGWSFPARVHTSPVSLDLAPERLMVEARARHYQEVCPEPGPGQFCAKTKRVVPRQGNTLEPIEVAWLIGPDAELRVHLPLQEAPRVLLDALLAAEDREYWNHKGVNFIAMLRAVRSNLQGGGFVQGGSTLTMQVVRNLVQRKEKTIERKLREMVMAMALDQHLGKEKVLQMYMDAPYLGQWGGLSICGFQAASRFYYGHDAAELTLAEAATLVAILPGPARFSPDKYPERAKERRDRVLRAMGQLFGYDITEALATPITVVKPEPLPSEFPAWQAAVRPWLEDRLTPAALYGAGLDITLSIDVFLQETTTDLFSRKVPYLQSIVGQKNGPPLQAASVLLDVQTGAILALFGGTDVSAVGFNRATQARRQAGSSFKPLVYAMALDVAPLPDGKPVFTSSTPVINNPRTFKSVMGNWHPRNVGGEYSTTAALAQGLAWSQNIATASLLEMLGGPRPLIQFAERMGYEVSRFPEEMGLALGQAEVTPLEMARFTGIVASGGRWLPASPVLRVVDAAGVDRLSPPRQSEQVLSPQAATLTRELMRLVVDVGTGGAARGGGGESGYPGELMGKTGTADKERDVWFIGATPRYSGALWLGYDVPRSVGATASDIAAPLFGWWFRHLTRYDGPPPKFPTEPKFVRRDICTITGKVPNRSCRRIAAPFLPGTGPREVCQESHTLAEVEMDFGDESMSLDERLEGQGVPPAKVEKRWESLWAKKAREEAERAAAAGGDKGEGSGK